MTVDPKQEGCHSGIDSRKVGKTAFSSPTHHPYLDPGVPPFTDQGAPRVTLQEEETVGQHSGSLQTGAMDRGTV